MNAATAESLQSCPTLCNPIDGSPPGSAVPGILQARTLEWVAISFSNAWKWKMKVKSLSCVLLFATPAYQALPSMGFSRQEYWNGVPVPSPSLHDEYPAVYPFFLCSFFSLFCYLTFGNILYSFVLDMSPLYYIYLFSLACFCPPLLMFIH